MDSEHVGGHLVLTKVVPQFASGIGVICLFEIYTVYSRDEPLCIFLLHLSGVTGINSG